MSQRPYPFPFGGGLNQVSSPLAIPPGFLVAALNYEPLAEGYGRVDGYERTDGRLPSAAGYRLLAIENGSAPIPEGATIIGATSAARAIVLFPPVGVTGSWDSGDAAALLVLVDVSGEFAIGEPIHLDGVAVADAVAASEPGRGDPARAEAAQTWARERIMAVPGSGPVRGVTVFNGRIIAARDDASGTAGGLWRATPAGWEPLTFGTVIDFTAGLAELVEGDVISQGSASATVRRVVRRTGDWGSSAAGYLVLSAQTGAFGAGALLRGGNAAATLSGNSDAVTLPPGGRYDFKTKNFYGASNLKRLYGCNGVGHGFELDLDVAPGLHVLAPIRTGMPVDTPQRVFEVANHLGFTFPGGSVQFAAPGEPLLFVPLLGAGEIGLGDDCTDVRDVTDSAVIFWCRNKVAALTGRDSESFQLEELTEEAGAEPWTAQRIGKTVYLDARGLRDVAATAAYGNFKVGALSELFEPYLKAKRRAGVSAVASLVARTKGQYRLFWSDGTGFSVFMGRKQPEMIPFDLGDKRVSCTAAGEIDGSEALLAGCEDGYVYRLDSGTSFDGRAVRAFAQTPYNHLGAARVDKRYHAADIELEAPADARIGIVAQFDYGGGAQPSDHVPAILVTGGGGSWDLSNWNEFYWSSPVEGTAFADIDGFGRNVSLLIAAESAVLEQPHILQVYTVYASGAGIVRRVN